MLSPSSGPSPSASLLASSHHRLRALNRAGHLCPVLFSFWYPVVMDTENKMTERRTVVLDRDLYEEAKDGTKFLVARKGDRITPSLARRHKVLPIESAAGPALESKVVTPAERQVTTSQATKAF